MKKIGLVLTVFAMCAVAQAGFLTFNCTFPDDPSLPLLYHTWSYTVDGEGDDKGDVDLALRERYTVPGSDSVNMFATTDKDPIVRATKYVTNANGHVWTGYTLTLNNASPGVSFTGVASSDVFQTVVVTPNLITFSNGTVAIGEEVAMSFRVLVANAGDFSWCVTQQAIPEPATLAILGLGALALLRKKN